MHRLLPATPLLLVAVASGAPRATVMDLRPVSTPMPAAMPPDEQNPGLELRRQLLSRELLKTMPAGAPNAVRAVVMDWALGPGQVATLVAFDDGTTSLYYNTGGGIIGAGSRVKVQQAVAPYRARAAADRAHFAPTTDSALPPGGTMRFWLVTPTATLASEAIPTEALRTGRHPLAQLAGQAQRVLTAIREAQ